jgi:vacuolar-type H+-ATPase subunit H
MEQIDQAGPFIEQAKSAARSFLDNAREEDRFIVQKTNGEAFDSRLVSADAAQKKIGQVEVEQRG